MRAKKPTGLFWLLVVVAWIYSAGCYIGARSVKWLSGITLQEEPSDNHFRAHEYKLFPPDATEETADLSEGMMLGELQVNAAICEPGDGA